MTFSHLWQSVAELFLKWEMFYTKVLEKIKTHILCSVTFFRKSCRLWDNVEKYSGAREVTDDNRKWSLRLACWISKVTRAPTHTEKCWISTVTRVSQMLFSVTLYVHCVLCFCCHLVAVDFAAEIRFCWKSCNNSIKVLTNRVTT